MIKLNRRKFCQCECGQIIKTDKKFAWGHNGVLGKGKKKAAPVWNKGLTKETDVRIAKAANKAIGRKPSPETIIKMREIQARPEIKQRKTETHKNKVTPQNVRDVIRDKCRIKSLETWEQKRTLGIRSHLYVDGRSQKYIPYPADWTEELKDKIKDRDGKTCQLCQTHESTLERALNVHHIDYDKNHCQEDNLISLCNSCHSKTNNEDRYYWYIMFKHMVDYDTNPNLYDAPKAIFHISSSEIDYDYGISRRKNRC